MVDIQSAAFEVAVHMEHGADPTVAFLRYVRETGVDWSMEDRQKVLDEAFEILPPHQHPAIVRAVRHVKEHAKVLQKIDEATYIVALDKARLMEERYPFPVRPLIRHLVDHQ